MVARKRDFGNEKRRLMRVFAMRRAGISPRHERGGRWTVESMSRPGTRYAVQVRLAREVLNLGSVGAALDATCTCKSRVECKHILAVRMEYNRDASFLFLLVGLDPAAGFNALISELSLRRAA